MQKKEYIERGALIETMFPIGMPNDGAYPINAKAVRVAIEKAPAADVVEVVRCKDCVCGRHPNKSDRFEALYPQEYLYCCVHESGVKKDGYCSYGKRKEQT